MIEKEKRRHVCLFHVSYHTYQCELHCAPTKNGTQRAFASRVTMDKQIAMVAVVALGSV